MRKTAVASDKPKRIPATKNSSTKRYWELKFPQTAFKASHINGFLVFVIVIFAFVIGLLTNKVIYLQQAVKAATLNAAANAAAPSAAPTPPQVVKVDNGHLPILGDKNAKVTIVEFSDFQCPFCKQYFDNTSQAIYDKYIKTGKVKFAYRQFPLTTIHPNAQIAAESSECAQEQNAFWTYHDLLFQNQDTWAPMTGTDVIDAFVGYAGQLGMNTDQFRSCVESHKYKKQVDDDEAAGEAVQVDGTPAFFINGYRIIGAQPESQFDSIIDADLKK